MSTNKIVFLQHDLTGFTGSGPNDFGFYWYGDFETAKTANKRAKTFEDLVLQLVPGSDEAKLAFPIKVQTTVDSAKTSMGVGDIDSYTEADSISWTLSEDKTELTMTAEFSDISNMESFQNKIENRNPWASIDVYQDFSKGEYTI